MIKRTTYYALLLLSFLLIGGCKSKEEKAESLIRSELEKSLYDFDSYKPIETKVTEAKQVALNDSATWTRAFALAAALNSVTKLSDEMKNAEERMDIWGAPTSYSSSYSDKQYYKYRDEYNENKAHFIIAVPLVKTLGESLTERLDSLDKNKVIGWEVYHTFRCKTRGGNNDIGQFRYILSSDFKSVLFREDMDDKKYRDIRELIEGVEKGRIIFDEL